MRPVKRAVVRDVDRPDSRALSVDADRAAVVAACAAAGVTISSIEKLASAGTHVVMMNVRDAQTMRAAFGDKLLLGEVMRTKWAQFDV